MPIRIDDPEIRSIGVGNFAIGVRSVHHTRALELEEIAPVTGIRRHSVVNEGRAIACVGRQRLVCGSRGGSDGRIRGGHDCPAKRISGRIRAETAKHHISTRIHEGREIVTQGYAIVVAAIGVRVDAIVGIELRECGGYSSGVEIVHRRARNGSDARAQVGFVDIARRIKDSNPCTNARSGAAATEIRLDHARRTASVSTHCIAVVAFLRAADRSATTRRDTNAGHTHARIPGFDSASCRTTIAGIGVAIVTRLAGDDHAVAANGGTDESGSRITRIAGTHIGPWRIAARCVNITGGRTIGAFIDVRAHHAITRVPGVACARKRAWSVRTVGIDVAVARSQLTFVDVGTGDSIAHITDVALAGEGSRHIRAARIRIAIIGAERTFIDVGAGYAITRIPAIAGAGERTRNVRARRIHVAIVDVQQAFVDILTHHAVAHESRIARASKRPCRVGTGRIHVAIVRAERAFIDVSTGKTIAHESRFAGAYVRTGNVRAVCIRIAVVCAEHAFVHVGTRGAIAHVPRIACTGERTWCIGACGIQAAVIEFLDTFIDILAHGGDSAAIPT